MHGRVLYGDYGGVFVGGFSVLPEEFLIDLAFLRGRLGVEWRKRWIIPQMGLVKEIFLWVEL